VFDGTCSPLLYVKTLRDDQYKKKGECLLCGTTCHITQIRFVLKGLNFGSVNRESARSLCSFLLYFKTQSVQNTIIAWSAFYTSHYPWHICCNKRRCKRSASACYSQLYQFPRSVPYDIVHPAGADAYLLQVPRFSNLLPNSFHHIQKWFLFLLPGLRNITRSK
jgi:hypothetical protein